MNVTYKIEVPNVPEPVEMTAEQIMRFHDELTSFINGSYESLTKEKDE